MDSTDWPFSASVDVEEDGFFQVGEGRSATSVDIEYDD